MDGLVNGNRDTIANVPVGSRSFKKFSVGIFINCLCATVVNQEVFTKATMASSGEIL